MDQDTPNTTAPTGDQPEAEAPIVAPAAPAGFREVLRIGQLAELCGKTVRALHLYEEMGLLKPVHRTKGGFRLYARSAVNRVQWIGRLQDAEVSLSEIKDFLRDLEEEQVASAAMTRVRALFEKKLQEIRRQQMRLMLVEADLSAGLRYLDACKTCEPEHEAHECGDCRLHGHDGQQPLMVAGLHHSRAASNE